jgi:membrane protease YdiL (CAAX protease family)
VDTQLNTKRILSFLAFTFGISWTAALVFYLIVGTDDPVRTQRLAIYLNFFFVLPVPALANLATRLITKEGWGRLMLRPNFRGGWRFYLAAWLLPLLAVIVGGAIYYLVFPQSFDPKSEGAREAVASIPALAAASSWTHMLVIMLNVLIIGLVLNGVISSGEELGWRGYLLPKLMEHFGGRTGASGLVPAHIRGHNAAGGGKAALLVGVIWGMWH